MLDHYHCPKYGTVTFEDNLGYIYECAEKLIEKINEEQSMAIVDEGGQAFKAEVDAQLFIQDGLFYSLTNEQYDETVDGSNVLNVSRLDDAGHECSKAINAYFDARTEAQLKEVTQLLESEHDEQERTPVDRDQLLSMAEELMGMADSLADEHRQVLEQKFNGNPYAEVA